MANYTSEVTAWYADVQFRAPPAADLAVYVAGLTSGSLTTAQVETAIIADPYTQDYVNPVIREYQAAFGRVPDQGGLSYWVNVVAANPTAGLAQLSTIFANSAEFTALYGATATTPASVGLVTSLYENVLGRAPDSAGLAYWSSQGLNAAQLLQAFAQSPEFIQDTTAAVATFEQMELTGAEPTTGSLLVLAPLPPSSATLTAGADVVNGVTNVTGDLSPFFYNGTGPTLNADDKITNVTNLTITDEYGTGRDIIPAGAQLANITNIILDTAGNAGAVGSPFDTSGITGVQTVTVNSSGGGVDFVNASATTAVTDNQASNGPDAGVQVTGGSAVTVTSSGGAGVVVGNSDLGSVPLPGQEPTGAVMVTEQGKGGVDVLGGTSVTVDVTNSANDGEISIGNTYHNTGDSAQGGAANPTGSISVTDDGVDGYIRIFGGSSVTVAASGDEVIVGSNGANALLNNTTGDVMVTDTAATPDTVSAGDTYGVYVRGGDNVTVTTNTGGVYVGDTEETTNSAGTAPQSGVNPSGNVTIVDTSSDVNNFYDVVDVAGGDNVNVTASGLVVTVGSTDAGVAFAPIGAVTVTDTSAALFDDVLNTFNAPVSVDGGTNVTVATNSGGVYIGSITGDAGANPSGNVTVTDTATGFWGGAASVQVFGGVNVTVTTASGSVYVGDATGGFNPTGVVSVTETGVNTGYQYHNAIDVGGGTKVTVVTSGVGVGDGITVGSDVAGGGSPVTGAVSITDTYSGRQHDDITVFGGTTVTINDTASSHNAIDIGEAPAVAGTTITNLADDPTGAVVVNDSSTFGTTTVYGTESFDIVTNGATSVSVTGGSGHDNSITDAQSALENNTGHLATVSLTGVNGVTSIASDELSTLTLADSTWVLADVTDTTASSKLTVNLADDANAHVEDADSSFTSVVVNTTGSSPSVLSLDAQGATSVTFNDTASLTLGDSWPGTDLDAVTTITATGAGALYLGDVTGFTDLTQINATAAAGGVQVELDPGDTSFAGGGKDVVVLSEPGQDFGAGVTISGGSGSTIYAAYDGTAADIPLGGGLGGNNGFSSFGVTGDAGFATGMYDVAGFTNLIVGGLNVPGQTAGITGVSGDITFTDVKPGATLDLVDINGDAPGGTVTYDLASPTATPATLSVTVGLDGATAATGSGSEAFGLVLSAGDNIGTLAIDSQGYAAGGGVNTLAVTDGTPDTVTAITITGDQSLTITDTTDAVKSINASASTGTVNVTGVDLADTGVTVTGGSGEIVANGYSATVASGVVDTFNVGAGGGFITLGEGGAGFTAGTPTMVGSETVNLTANAADGTTIVASSNIATSGYGTFGIVNNWDHGTVGSGQTADSLELVGTPEVIANATNVAGASGAIYNVTDGVISLATNSTVPSGTVELTDAQGIVDKSVTPGTVAMVTVPVTGGNGQATFVIENQTGGGANDIVFELSGVTGSTGFGAISDATDPADPANIGAGTSVTLSGFSNYNEFFTNVSGAHAGASTANVTYTDTGLSLDTLTASGTGFTNTYTGLANFGILETDTTGGGNVVVTQVGVDPVLTVSATNDTTLNNLTYGNSAVANDDPTLLLYSYAGSLDINGSLIDASNTGTTVLIAGNEEVTVGGISDTALKTVNASELDAVLTLTASQKGLTIVGSLDGDAITASGAGDTISVGSDVTTAGAPVTISAAGAGDHISVYSDSVVHIGASGAGDTITVVDDVDTAYVTGNGDSVSTTGTQLGANDTINVGDATVSANVHAWLGANSTVNLASGSSADLHLLGDTAGASLTNMTVINGVNDAALRLHFNEGSTAVTTESWAGGNSVDSQVNVSGQTTLAGALNLAASQAGVEAFQFNGGTGATTGGGAVEIKGNTGLVDWFQYQGNTYLVEATNNTGAPAAHAALAANDTVVELTGIVDVNHIHVALA